MFTFKVCLPFLVIIAVFFVGVVVNLIQNDHVFKHYDGKHGRSNHNATSND